jgi:hypothetical protein
MEISMPPKSPGRPRGAKNRLQKAFLEELASDFEEHGAAVIKLCRIEQPHNYLKVIASLMPRDLHLEAYGHLDDETIDTLIENFHQRLLEQRQQQPILIEDQPIKVNDD